jgi:hypothetical protein
LKYNSHTRIPVTSRIEAAAAKVTEYAKLSPDRILCQTDRADAGLGLFNAAVLDAAINPF